MKRFALLLSLAFSTLLLSFSGCGERLPSRYPVGGHVSFRGKPLAEATVLFHPLGPSPPGLAQPMAITDADGSFRLTTARSDDGAVPGDYAVTVTLPALVMIGDEETRNGPNTLPSVYAEPETTPIKYTVVEGTNVVPPIDLE